MLVKLDATIFIRIVFLKLAKEGFRQTCKAHPVKYTRTGSIQVDKIKNSFSSRDISKKYVKIAKAIP